MRGLLPSILLLLLPVPALYEDGAADALIRAATESTYMLRLSDARAAARELQRKYSDHPAGFMIEAETYWWEAQEDPGNAKIENNYYHAQQVAQEKSERALQAAKYYKPELLAYLASAYGSYARFQITQKGAYLGALRAGLKAHDYAVQTYTLDKDYYDIYVGLGAFNYFAGTLPVMIKPFAFLIGASGNKNLGVSQLQTAMEKARYSKTEARIVYYSALLSNKEYAPAFPILEKLIADFPDNFVLYDWAEIWFQEQKKLPEGIEYFERAYEKQSGRSPLMAQYTLLDKGDMQLGASKKADVIQTVQRIRAIPSSDSLVTKKVNELEKAAKK
jgi:tetratricopeptide (TPR) repeat protein